MRKFENKKGFTLAELLIVVAIIAVLVAIAIPVFTTQLERAREATDIANIRSAYAEATAAILAGEDTEGSFTATTPPAQSTGEFQYSKPTDLTWLNVSGLSANKGKPFSVKVTISDAGSATVEVTPGT